MLYDYILAPVIVTIITLFSKNFQEFINNIITKVSKYFTKKFVQLEIVHTTGDQNNENRITIAAVMMKLEELELQDYQPDIFHFQLTCQNPKYYKGPAGDNRRLKSLKHSIQQGNIIRVNEFSFFYECKIHEKNSTSTQTLIIKTYTKDLKAIQEFIRNSVAEYADYYYPTIDPKIYVSFYLNKALTPAIEFKSSKTFDTTFIDDKDNIKMKLDQLKSKEIPKLGILLYGLPGSGKTSCIKSIINYMKRGEVIIIKLNAIVKHDLLNLLSKKDKIFIFEDIDCDTSSVHDRKTISKDDRELGLSLSDILNCLDGIIELNDSLIVMTTNDISKLDSALIRPGRIDLKIELNKMSKKSMNEMIKYHFNGDSVKDKYLKDNFILGCDLENLIVDSGKSIEKLEKALSLHK